PECVEPVVICLGSRTYEDIDTHAGRIQRRKKVGPGDLPEPPLKSIPAYGGRLDLPGTGTASAPWLRNDQPNTRTRGGGSGDEDVQAARLSPLPPSKERPDFVRPRDPRFPREPAPCPAGWRFGRHHRA